LCHADPNLCETHIGVDVGVSVFVGDAVIVVVTLGVFVGV
jgi:hypothetical protein